MQRRRFHSKSRRGCLQCKKNRTKCDENVPTCGRCNRIGAECSLVSQTDRWTFVSSESKGCSKPSVDPHWSDRPPTATTISESGTSDSGKTVVATASQSISRGPQIAPAERERLKLMNHYALHVSKTISDMVTPGNSSIWSDWVPGQAFEHDFLLHCILGLSALHLGLNGVAPRQQALLSSRHYDRGITLFRPHLSHITIENYDAALSFSYLTVLHAFGTYRPVQPGMNPITSLVDLLRLLRGSSALINSNPEAREHSIWYKLVAHEVVLPPRLPDELEDMLSSLSRRVSSLAPDDALKNVYTLTLRSLRLNFSIALTYKSMKSIAVFAVTSPAEFWARPHLDEPLALAILANYSVVLHWLRGNIWLQGWGKAVIGAIHSTLPTEWHDTIAWAVQEAKEAGSPS
ncbi:putative Zn(2)-C6 fungal-type domain-containing protein [Seiridium unicorne]|uniref:Zn(2)-C6 fungal-type domain-containing protein n=1 Tax=Seiridium unicorne TaxID=138068 RepID=A0ABR2UGN7_9PEZI